MEYKLSTIWNNNFIIFW